MKARAVPLSLTIVLLLAGCGQEAGKNSPYNASGFDTAKDEAAAEDTVQRAHTGSIPVTANDLATLILDGPVPDHLDETSVQLLIDSLFATDPATRQMLARAFTKLWPKADGAIAESMGLAALDYVSANPAEFIALFDKELSEADLTVWADMLAQELLIDHETGAVEAWSIQAPQLEHQCASGAALHRKRISAFTKLVGDRIKELSSAS